MPIYQATVADIPAILWLRKLASDNPLRYPLTACQLHRALQRHCCAWIAVSAQQQKIGFALANKKTHHLWGLFVLAAYQRQGYGGQLLNSATDWLWAHSGRTVKWLWLDTQIAAPAETFYQYQGWQRGKKVNSIEVRYWLARPGREPLSQVQQLKNGLCGLLRFW
jgi:GNAT superfamily N-acetyltransferase